jgi:singapore isolate B (sub-type 7) whole genome shotgun sequence assembly, scaffold_8
LSHIINGMNSPEFKQTFGDSDDAISLEMSYLEDYQNNIYDLLSPSPRYGQNKTSLMARSDTQGVLHVVGLTVC